MAAAISDGYRMENSGKMPDTIHVLMSDLAAIRQTILINAPACLPQLAPVLIDAEKQVNALWS